MEPQDQEQSWLSYQRLVLGELQRHSMVLDGVMASLAKVHVEMAMIEARNKVYSTLFGFIGACVPVLAGLAVEIYMRH